MNDSTPCDILFISELGLWPLDQGFRVHGTQMARALGSMGVGVAMTSLGPTCSDAPSWLKDMLLPWPSATEADKLRFADGWGGRARSWRKRIANHQAIDTGELAGIISLVWRYKPKAVIALGQHGPLMLQGLAAALPQTKTIWYAADEPVSFELSCLAHQPRGKWKDHLRLMAVFALMQRLFARNLDAAIGVSSRDSKLLHHIGGIRLVRTIPNGVDLQRFTPPGPGDSNQPKPRSIIFWGRMDFEPNIDGVRWFAEHVWLDLHRRSPDATWNIVGKNPTAEVTALESLPGVQVVGEVADIITHARQGGAAILPMRCGAGIKNKLLEAAAMGMPIVASPRAIQGLTISDNPAPALLTSRKPGQWVESIWRLWNDPALAACLGREARAWVEQHHTWAGAGAKLLALVNDVLPATTQIPTPSSGAIDQTQGQIMPTGQQETDVWHSKAA